MHKKIVTAHTHTRAHIHPGHSDTDFVITLYLTALLDAAVLVTDSGDKTETSRERTKGGKTKRMNK